MMTEQEIRRKFEEAQEVTQNAAEIPQQPEIAPSAGEACAQAGYHLRMANRLRLDARRARKNERFFELRRAEPEKLKKALLNLTVVPVVYRAAAYRIAQFRFGRAVVAGDVKAAEAAIRAGADVGAGDDLAFRYACGKGDVEMARLLFLEGADGDAREGEALKKATERGDGAMRDFLEKDCGLKYQFTCPLQRAHEQAKKAAEEGSWSDLFKNWLVCFIGAMLFVSPIALDIYKNGPEKPKAKPVEAAPRVTVDVTTGRHERAPRTPESCWSWEEWGGGRIWDNVGRAVSRFISYDGKTFSVKEGIDRPHKGENASYMRINDMTVGELACRLVEENKGKLDFSSWRKTEIESRTLLNENLFRSVARDCLAKMAQEWKEPAPKPALKSPKKTRPAPAPSFK